MVSFLFYLIFLETCFCRVQRAENFWIDFKFPWFTIYPSLGNFIFIDLPDVEDFHLQSLKSVKNYVPQCFPLSLLLLFVHYLHSTWYFPSYPITFYPDDFTLHFHFHFENQPDKCKITDARKVALKFFISELRSLKCVKRNQDCFQSFKHSVQSSTWL